MAQDLTTAGSPGFLNTVLTQPTGIYAYGVAYTTGDTLSSTPAAVAIPLTEGLDATNKWTVNVDSNGYVAYSGTTRYFLVIVTFDIASASGPGSTVTIKLQKKTGIVWDDLPGSEIDRYLSGTLDTGALAIQGVTSMANGNALRLEISSDSDVPTYAFAHLQFVTIALG